MKLDISVQPQGDANVYALLNDGNWLAQVRMNGELMPSRQESILRLLASAPELLGALTIALQALDAIGDEMTVGDRFTNAGQDLIDALQPARAAIAKTRGTQP